MVRVRLNLNLNLNLNTDPSNSPRNCNVLVLRRKATLNPDNLVSEFQLTEENELVGYVRPGTREYTKIPALIELN